MTPQQILEQTADIVAARGVQYGDASDVFETIAQLWSAYLGQDVQPHEVGDLLALMKFGRAKHSRNPDHRRDVIGYAALSESLEQQATGD